MRKEVITNYQGIALITLFISGSTLIMATGSGAGKDFWIAILAAIILACLVLTVYARLLTLFPEKDLIEILQVIFGKVGGKILTVLYTWFAFHLGSLVLRNFGDYLATVGLTETPEIVIMVCFAILCLWGAKEGIEVLGRWSTLFLNLIIMLLTIVILVSIKNWNIDNLLPVFYNGYKPVIKGVCDVLAFPLTEVVIFTMIIKNIKGSNSVYKMFWGGLGIGGLMVFIISLSEVLILGIDLYSGAYFPSQMAASVIKVGNFFERIEIIPTVAFLSGGFIKISVCMLAASKGVTRLFNCTDYSFMVTPIALLMINLSYFIYDDIVQMANVASFNWKYYALPFEVILPILILLVAEVKVRSGRQEKNSLRK